MINQMELQFGNVWLEERGKPENPEKTSCRKDKNRQQTKPTYDTESGIEPEPHW